MYLPWWVSILVTLADFFRPQHVEGCSHGHLACSAVLIAALCCLRCRGDVVCCRPAWGRGGWWWNAEYSSPLSYAWLWVWEWVCECAMQCVVWWMDIYGGNKLILKPSLASDTFINHTLTNYCPSHLKIKLSSKAYSSLATKIRSGKTTGRHLIAWSFYYQVNCYSISLALGQQQLFETILTAVASHTKPQP